MTGLFNTVDENFSIEFSGPALTTHEISASALAQSLLALDSLARHCAQSAYGRHADIEIKVKGTPRAGSFVVDLIIQHSSEILSSGAGAVTILMGVIALSKWAFGKKVKKEKDAANGHVFVQNEIGQTVSYNASVVNVYNHTRTATELSRLTQTLDHAGVDAITLSDGKDTPERITKTERAYFHQGEGIILTDNEATLLLEIVGAKFNGSPNGWTFSESGDTQEFTARIEDEDFLRAVKANEYILKNGTTILAVMRTVQMKIQRTITERSIIEVMEVHSPDEDA